jgi:hypothetical protein
MGQGEETLVAGRGNLRAHIHQKTVLAKHAAAPTRQASGLKQFHLHTRLLQAIGGCETRQACPDDDSFQV